MYMSKALSSSCPLLSIVIANFNYGRFLEDSILSVLNQSEKDFELIVVDGGSTDNSVEIIKKYQRQIAWWCSEKDKGQSHAFNKGFEKAKGLFLTWLNADDLMFPSVVSELATAHKRFPLCQWFTGNFVRFINSTGEISEVGWGPHFVPSWMQNKHSAVIAFGPSTFFSKNIYLNVGGIDERFHYVMDMDLWQRFIIAGVKQRRLKCFCFAFRMHEESKTASYDGHALSKSTYDKMVDEGCLSRQKTGYAPWRGLYYCLLLWRLFDCSIIRRFWLKKRMLGKSLNHLDCAPSISMSKGVS